MVWYGMVWYGMVWYGMVWYGMVWYGMVWYGMVWYGTALEGVISYVHKDLTFWLKGPLQGNNHQKLWFVESLCLGGLLAPWLRQRIMRDFLDVVPRCCVDQIDALLGCILMLVHLRPLQLDQPSSCLQVQRH